MNAPIGRAALIVAAVSLAWFFTRTAGPLPTTTPGGGHQHGAAAPTAGPGPVLLTDRNQHRIGVTFAPVLRGPLAHQVRIVAQVTYDETRVTTVASRFEGWVQRVSADFVGRPVRAGEPLLWIDAPMVVTTAEELLLARRLAADLGGGSAEAQTNADRLVQSARERLQRWQQLSNAEVSRIESSGQAPHSVIVRSPVNGVVLDKAVLPGQRVMEGEVLYRIADPSVIWLEGDVFEQDLALVHLGQPVTVELPAFPEGPRTGRIAYVYPALNPETRTGRVRVTLSNPGLALKPGMFATIRLAAPIADRALSIPRGAVLSTGERNLVFLKRPDGRFTPTDVALGVQTEDRIEIVGGLAEGDTVVASATFLLDAESNLGTLLGGMGDMPGMDMTAPDAPVRLPVARPARETPPDSISREHPPAPDAMPDLPGMDMPAVPDSHAGHDHHPGQGE